MYDPVFLSPPTAVPFQLQHFSEVCTTSRVTDLVMARWSSLCKYNVLFFIHVLLGIYYLQTSYCIERIIAKACLTKGSTPGQGTQNIHLGAILLKEGNLNPHFFCLPLPLFPILDQSLCPKYLNPILLPPPSVPQ